MVASFLIYDLVYIYQDYSLDNLNLVAIECWVSLFELWIFLLTLRITVLFIRINKKFIETVAGLPFPYIVSMCEPNQATILLYFVAKSMVLIDCGGYLFYLDY